MQVSTIGVDLAKNVFQVHGVDSAGKVVISRQLRRKQVMDFLSKISACLVGMEACGTAHHWAREVSKLGHTVRLMPPSYVKGYVKRSKNDAADAAAICEAVTRPSMRFVPIKSADQQASLMLHRTRDLLIRQRTQLINALRAHLAEFGLVAETGREGLAQLAAIITDESNREALPSAMKQALQAIVDQLAALELQIGTLDRAIHAHHRANDMSCRLETVPGIGVIGATAIASTVTDPSDFKSGRDFEHGSDLCRGSTPREARSGSAASPSGRSLSPAVARHRCNSRCSTSPAASAKASLDHETAGQEASQARRCCRCQQDGAHRLGDHGQGRILSSAGACCSHLKRLGNGSVRRRRSKTIELRG